MWPERTGWSDCGQLAGKLVGKLVQRHNSLSKALGARAGRWRTTKAIPEKSWGSPWMAARRPSKLPADPPKTMMFFFLVIIRAP